MTRRWLGHLSDTSQIDIEEYVREHPVEEPDYTDDTDRGERMYEQWLDGEA